MRDKIVYENNQWFFERNGERTLIREENFRNYIHWALKQILFEDAWNSDEHTHLMSFFRYLRGLDSERAREVVRIEKKGYISLLEYLEQLEKKGFYNEIDIEGDYSDDSDNEPEYNLNGFNGADLARDNAMIMTLQLKFVNKMKKGIAKNQYSGGDIFKESEIKNFKEAISADYRKHLKTKGLVADVDLNVTSVESGYRIKYKLDGETHKVRTNAKPFVNFYRGIGYFTDRWHADARRTHREELSSQDMFSEAIYKHTLRYNPWLYYDRFANLPVNAREQGEKALKGHARELTGNLIALRNSNPVIMTQGSNERIFANLLEFMQFVYTNGIERFLPLIRQLQEVKMLEELFPEEGNFMVSMSELPTHAFRYARGTKNPYSEYELKARYDKNGKPEKPYSGKLTVTTHEISEFQKYSKPNILREMKKLGSVTAPNEIGNELEVSFLGRIPKEKFKYSQKIRVPSFTSKKMPEHFLAKYGITPDMYQLIRHIIRDKHGIKDNVIDNLREFISFYHSVRIVLWQLQEANIDDALMLFLNENNGFSTKIPNWIEIKSERNKVEAAESRYAKTIEKRKEIFNAKAGEVYGKMLKVSIIEKKYLSKEWQEEINDRRDSGFGGKSPEATTTNFREYDHFSGKNLYNDFLEESTVSELDLSTLFFDHIEYVQNIIAPPRRIPLENDNPAWEVDVFGDGNCLFYSLIMGYLFPYTSNPQIFNERYLTIFGNLNDAENLRINMSDFVGTIEWFEDNLQHRVDNPGGLRSRLVSLLPELNEVVRNRVLEHFEEQENAETVSNYINNIGVTGRNFANIGEATLFAILTNSNVVFYQNHNFNIIMPDGSISEEYAGLVNENTTRVMFVNGNHFHVVLPQNILTIDQNSRFADLSPSIVAQQEMSAILGEEDAIEVLDNKSEISNIEEEEKSVSDNFDDIEVNLSGIDDKDSGHFALASEISVLKESISSDLDDTEADFSDKDVEDLALTLEASSLNDNMSTNKPTSMPSSAPTSLPNILVNNTTRPWIGEENDNNQNTTVEHLEGGAITVMAGILSMFCSG